MTPKALWIKQNEPHVWKNALHICEYQDYINYKLTGIICASSCNAAARWHWDGEECVDDDYNSFVDSGEFKSEDTSTDSSNQYRGRPMSLYAKLGISELADKLPKHCIGMGSLVGHLAKEAASQLGLREGLPVAQGKCSKYRHPRDLKIYFCFSIIR